MIRLQKRACLNTSTCFNINRIRIGWKTEAFPLEMRVSFGAESELFLDQSEGLNWATLHHVMTWYCRNGGNRL
ncbi:hypothetical protein AVEN_249483-1, partial [Araneus ventricosus]